MANDNFPDIPDSVKEEIAHAILHDSKIITYSRKIKECIINRDFINSGKYQQMMEEERKRVMDRIMDKYEHYDVTLAEAVKNMPTEDAMEFRILLEMMTLLADALEGSLVEFNSILGKYRRSERNVSYDPLLKTMKELRLALKSQYGFCSEYHQETMGDYADKVYELVKGKATQMVKRLIAHQERLEKAKEREAKKNKQ